MNQGHLVWHGAEAKYEQPGGWAATARGYRRWTAVGEGNGAVHTGFGICVLQPGGHIPAHVHSFEETFYVLEGAGIITTSEGSYRVRPGDYAALPVGAPHAWRTDGDRAVSWAELQGPAPRERFGDDTFLVPLESGEPIAVDVRDPRMRRFGNITPAHLDALRLSQELLPEKCGMRAALMVYGGITVQMMADTDLGSQLTSMFMVQFLGDGQTSQHDHPFEETYLILEGAADAVFDGERYRMRAGDIAWSGVGCVHSIRNAGPGPVRWLETQSPQPPTRHSHRFARDWEYLSRKLAGNEEADDG
jgi:mannose-6-phosphate isomerase-like protein (cupin superfamily)